MLNDKLHIMLRGEKVQQSDTKGLTPQIKWEGEGERMLGTKFQQGLQFTRQWQRRRRGYSRQRKSPGTEAWKHYASSGNIKKEHNEQAGKEGCSSLLQAAVTKHHKLGDLKKQIDLAQLRRPVVRNQSVTGVGSFWRILGKICFMPLSQLLQVASNPWCSLACSYITTVTAFIVTWPPDTDTSHWIQGPP